MKTLSFVYQIFVLVSFSILCSCSEPLDGGGEEYSEWLDQLNEEDQKIIESTGYIRLYYLNEDGTGWIDPQKTETFPIAHFEETNNPQNLIDEVKFYGSYCSYNKGLIGYDEEEKLYYCEPNFFLDGTTDYSFPIYWNGCVDRIKTSFIYRYILKGCTSVYKYSYFPTKCEYNNVQLFNISPEGEGNLWDIWQQKIFIRKTADGVSVSFKR